MVRMSGTIRKINGTPRMRYVRAPYDATDLSVPPNAVLFDSDHDAYLQVFLSGSFLITSNSGFQKYVTWPPLDYVPFVYAIYRNNSRSQAPMAVGTSSIAGQVSVTNDGLTIATATLNYPAYLDYIVFRAAAA